MATLARLDQDEAKIQELHLVSNMGTEAHGHMGHLSPLFDQHCPILTYHHPLETFILFSFSVRFVIHILHMNGVVVFFAFPQKSTTHRLSSHN